MVEKINQSMLSLAENNKDFKTALRFMLKCEIQLLLDRLAELGDESLLVIANKSEESTSHFGSSCAETYLQACTASLNFSVKDTFLKHCLQTSPATSLQPKTTFTGQTMGQTSVMSNESQEQGQPINSVVSSVPGQMMNSSANLVQGQGQSVMNSVISQGQALNTNISPITGHGHMLDSVGTMSSQGHMINPLMVQGQMVKNPISGTVNEVMLRAAAMLQMGHQANMMNRQAMGLASNYGRQQLQTNRFNPYQQQAVKITGSSQKTSTAKQEDIELKRAVCRHFARGHCWQGNMCAFLHVHQDPDSSEDKDTKDKKTIDSTTDLTKDATEATASSTAFGNAVVK